MRHLRQVDGKKIIHLLNAHRQENRYSEIFLENRHFHRACEWLSRFDFPLRSLNALHSALTEYADATLITADNRLAESAGVFGIEVKLLEL